MDCMHYSEKNGKFRCKILTVHNCDPDCAFRRTHCEAEQGRQEANKRLRSLDEEYQANIAGKYYNGEMPWRKE